MNNKLFRYNTEIKIVQSSIKKINPQFSLCDVLVCYHGDNRNMTSLPKKVIEDNLYSIYGIPIVGEWIYKLDGTNEKTWGSHGGRIILDDQGIHFEQTTKPFGFVTKGAADNASWVTITEKDGHTQNEYLKLSGCILWTERYEESKSILDDNYGQSMEIEFKKGHYRDDHYYEAEEFIFSALCILGTDCTPCFESACIGRHYELDSFKKEFTLMLDEYKKFNNSTKKGDHQMELKKFVEALSPIKITDTENSKYALLSVTDTKVNVLDMEDYKAYAFDYAITSENDVDELVINFDSKVEMSLSACEKITEEGFEEFSISDVINTISTQKTNEAVDNYTRTAKEEFNTKITELSVEYENLNKSYTEAMKLLDTYQAADAAREKKEHDEAIDEVVSEFSKRLSRVPEFLIYKARLDYSKSVEEIKKDLTLMAGKSVMDTQTKSSFSYNPVSTTYSKNNKSQSTTNRYGHLLDKFAK